MKNDSKRWDDGGGFGTSAMANGDSPQAVRASEGSELGGSLGNQNNSPGEAADKTLRLSARKVSNLLSYLERLVVPPLENGQPINPRLKTQIIMSDVIALMQDISRQSGVPLLDDTPVPTPGLAVSDECADHIRTARGTCALCGVKC